jgi:hypothetical protein
MSLRLMVIRLLKIAFCAMKHRACAMMLSTLAFHGFDAAMGQTYEVWFIRGGFRYEISTYKELEPWLNQILATWRFTKY